MPTSCNTHIYFAVIVVCCFSHFFALHLFFASHIFYYLAHDHPLTVVLHAPNYAVLHCTRHMFVIAHLPAELMACRPTELPTYACPALFVSLFSFFALHSPLFVHLLLLAAPPLILHCSFLSPLHPIVAHNVRSLVQWLFNRLLFSAFDSDFFPIIAIPLFRRVASLLLQFFPCLLLFSVEVAHAQPVDALQFLESLTGSLVV